MEYCLIETWSSEYTLPRNCKLIALTVEASDQLKVAGLEYQSFDDFFKSSELLGDTSSYLDSQHQWFSEFDEYVRNIFPSATEMNVSLASLYSYNIKYLVDGMILASRVVNKFLDEASPSRIWVIATVNGDDAVYRHRWFTYGKSIIMRLIEPICKQRNIQFTCLYSIHTDSNANTLGLKQASLIATLKSFSRKCAAAVQSSIKYTKEWCIQFLYLAVWPSMNRSSKVNILILKGSRHILNVCRDCRKAGFDIFIKNGDSIYKRAFFRKTEKLDYGGRDGVELSAGHEWGSIVSELMSGDIVRWISEKCGLDVSPILEKRFRYILCELFPDTLIRIKVFADLYNENRIDYVVCSSLGSEDDYAGVAAARVSNNTKSVGFAHGMDAFEAKCKYIGEYSHLDLYFSSTSGEVDNIRKLARQYGKSQICVNEFSNFRNTRPKLSKMRRLLYKWDKPVAVFVPIRRIDRMHMPITRSQFIQWNYFKWHYALIDYFASRDDYTFIWKAVPSQDGKHDFVSQVIECKNSSNIAFSTTDLNKWLSIADRVICDVPSTAFYESIINNLPTLGFYCPDDQVLSEDAYCRFETSLRPRSTIDEGLGTVEDFLDGDTSRFQVSLPKSDAVVPDVLRGYLHERSIENTN